MNKRKLNYKPDDKIGCWIFIEETESQKIQFQYSKKIHTLRRAIIKCSNCNIIRNRALSSLNLNTVGCKNCNMLPKGHSGLKILYNGHLQRAKFRGGKLKLTIEEFKILTSLPCHYCNAEPSYKERGSSNNEWTEYIYNGLDRIDSNIKDYDNTCVPCCWLCNRAKRDMTYKDFINYLNRIAEFVNTKKYLTE